MSSPHGSRPGRRWRWPSHGREDDKSRRRASAQGMAISRSDELGLVDGDGINVGEQVRRRSRVRVLAFPLPMVPSLQASGCGLSAAATRKRWETCPIRSGTRCGWPVARGSVCQMQVVSNHRSGVAARKPPLLGISHARYRQGIQAFPCRSLSAGGQIAQSAYTGRPRPTWVGPRAAPSCCREMRSLPMSLCTCVPRFNPQVHWRETPKIVPTDSAVIKGWISQVYRRKMITPATIREWCCQIYLRE